MIPPVHFELVSHALEDDRIAAFREQPVKRRPALELAGIVLPFNFR